MYVIREVLHCKPGKARPMVEKFRGISAALQEMGQEPLRLSRFTGLLFLYSLSSALVGGVGRDAEHIVGHIVSGLRVLSFRN